MYHHSSKSNYVDALKLITCIWYYTWCDEPDKYGIKAGFIFWDALYMYLII